MRRSENVMPEKITRNLGLSLIAFMLAACQAQTDEDDANAGGSKSSNRGTAAPINVGTSSGDSGVSPASGSPGFTLTPEGRCLLNISDQPCSYQAFETENVPLDIYVMFDRSGSMCNCVDPPNNDTPCPDPTCRKTRMQAIREAMSGFMSDAGSNGMGIGVGYFGQQEQGSADCRPETYATPYVTMAELPANATNVMASLNTADPLGETPTGAAIRGACSYARQWKAAHMEREVVILFVTDGEPKAPVTCPNGSGACCPSLVDANQAASECFSGTTKIRTYVLGVGPYLENLSQIAAAGGTEKAYLVDIGGDVTQQILAALNEIRGNATIPCQFELPKPSSGSSLDLNKINVAYANSSCQGTVFYRVDSVSGCTTSGGWYYDNPIQPSRVELCPSSCQEISGPAGRLAFYVGCTTLTPLL